SKYSQPVSIDELSKGFCKSYHNAVRLIEDGEILLKTKRYLSALNCFRLGLEELSKAHLIIQAATFDADDEMKWKWFWDVFKDHKKKTRLLEYELHWESNSDENKFHEIVNTLVEQRTEAIYVQFDIKNEKFLSPEDFFPHQEGIRKYLINEFKYVKHILSIFTSAGIPTPNTMKKVMSMLKKGIACVETPS
ncbi:MAG: AbiV family abortive infection protein, partial [Promethearchaeota archaeon]